MGLFEDELQRSAQRRAQLNAQARAKAQQDAGAGLTGTLANIAKETASPSKKSFLENIFGGIAEGIGDAAATVGNIAKTAAGLMGNATHKEDTKRTMQDLSAKRDEIAKKYGYANYLEAQEDDNASQDFWNEIKGAAKGTQEKLKKSSADFDKSIQDVQNIDLNKAKGQAINTIGNMLDVVPGLGVAGNVASGALGGVADAYKANEGGTDADVWNDKTTLARIGAGAGSALAGGAVASKLGAGKTVLGQAGRSALSGAASGATSGAIMSGATGGNVLSGALSGAGTGALAGGAMGGGNAIAGRIMSGVRSVKGANDVAPKDFNTTNDAMAENTSIAPEQTMDAVKPQQAKNSNTIKDGIANQKRMNQVEDLRMQAAQQILDQYGTIRLTDKTKLSRAAEAATEMANLGLTDRASIDYFANNITGADGQVSKLVRNALIDAGDTTTKLKHTMDEYYNSGGIAGNKSAKSYVQSVFDDVSKKYSTNQDGTMSRSDMYDLGREIERIGYNDIAMGSRSGSNSHIYEGRGQTLVNIAQDIIDRATEGVEINSKIDTNALKSILPDNQAWANKVDKFAANAKTVQDARKFMAPATQMSLYNEATRLNRGTYGSNVGDAGTLMLELATGNTLSRLKTLGKLAQSKISNSDNARQKQTKKLLDMANKLESQGVDANGGDRLANNNMASANNTATASKNPLVNALGSAKNIASNLNGLQKTAGGDNNLAKYLAGQANDLGGNFYKWLDGGAPTLRAGGINNLQNIVNRQVAGGIADNAVSDLRDKEYEKQANQAISDAVGQYGAGVLNYIGTDATNGLSDGRLAQLQSVAGQYPAEADASAMLAGAMTAEQNNPMSEQMAQIGNQMTQISQAMSSAMAAGDFTAYGQLADLYAQAYKMYDALNATSAASEKTNELTASQQTQMTNLNNSLATRDQLEQAYADAGGAQGLAGNLSEFANSITGGAANRALANYNSMRQSVGAAIVKNLVNLGATEQDMKAYVALLPTAADSAEQAQDKFDKLRGLINQAKANVTVAQ